MRIIGAKYTSAQNNATQRYIKKAYDRIVVCVKKGKREKYKEIAKKSGKSLNQYIVDLLDREIEKDLDMTEKEVDEN